jgi:hypothetical protein
VAHRLASDSEPRSTSQLFQVVYTESFSGDKNIIVLAERGPEIDILQGKNNCSD